MRKIAIVFSLALCMFSGCSLPNNKIEPTLDKLSFVLNDDSNSYSVKGLHQRILGNIVIPSEYLGLPVTSILERGFYCCLDIICLNLPHSISNIGDEAFQGCVRLVEVINHSSLDIQVGSWNYGAVGLFAKQIISNESNSKVRTTNDGFVVYDDGVDTILIADFNFFETLYVPQYVTSIGNYALHFRGYLISVILPDSVTSIGLAAFAQCGSLSSITFSNNIKIIDIAAFDLCWSLSSITLPTSVEKIEWHAFYECTGLKDIYYKGYIQEWRTIILNDAFETEITVHCHDGDIVLNSEK